MLQSQNNIGLIVVSGKTVKFENQNLINSEKMKSRKLAILPAGYGKFLSDLKARIRNAQIKAALSLNRESILLYWDIGCRILAQQNVKDGAERLWIMSLPI